MPFSQKHAYVGATFQILMTKIFEWEIRRQVIVYVDNLLVKGKEVESQVKDLEEVFQTSSSGQPNQVHQATKFWGFNLFSN